MTFVFYPVWFRGTSFFKATFTHKITQQHVVFFPQSHRSYPIPSNDTFTYIEGLILMVFIQVHIPFVPWESVYGRSGREFSYRSGRSWYSMCMPWEAPQWAWEKPTKLGTLPETNIFAPENRPSQKERIVFQRSIFRCELLVWMRVVDVGRLMMLVNVN